MASIPPLDAPKSKKCNACKVEKPVAEFYKKGRNAQRYGLCTFSNLCKVCAKARAKIRNQDPNIKKNRKEYTKRYRAENKEKVAAGKKKWVEENKSHVLAHKKKYYDENRRALKSSNLQLRYGITIEDYDRMAMDQGGLCAICGSSDTKNRRTDHFAVDHCHKTGQVRGLLCRPCNQGLGHFEDDIENMNRALSYLKKYGGVS